MATKKPWPSRADNSGRQNIRKIILIFVIFLTISVVFGIFFWGERLNRQKINTVVATARSKENSRFDIGAQGEEKFNSSGFVWWVFQKQNNIKLGAERASANDYRAIGVHIEKKNLKEGDLLFFGKDQNEQTLTVGIYIGNNEFIHASQGYGRVLINNFSDRLADVDTRKANSKKPTYQEIFIEARRIIGLNKIANPESIKKGDEGVEVRNMQKDLLFLGYKVPTDGAFEEKTEEAIRMIQADFSLPTDGVATPGVQEVIREMKISAGQGNAP